MEEIRYWIWLSQLNISPKARASVLQDFGNPETAFHSAEGSFRRRKGISNQEVELLEARSLDGTDDILARCEDQELVLLPFTADEYPQKLRETAVPPAILFVKGSLPALDELPVISVIGTRRASPYGIKMGERLAYEIARCGGTVVSLLSPGVDEAAARGALRAGKACIGVLGTSHEQCHYSIAQEILRYGALISEYPPGRDSSRHFFRERNRVAAGISDGVVVVEAPEKSGTRLFVNDAVDQGKDIFAIPGNADAENAVGTLALLKEGAKLVTTGAEVMEEYLLRYPEGIVLEPEEETAASSESREENPETKAQKDGASESEAASAEQVFRAQLSQLTEDQLKIVAAIDPGSTYVDDITERTGLSTARVLAQLTVLEIKGIVRREAGRRFALNLTIVEK